jgi:hypothetical protein
LVLVLNLVQQFLGYGVTMSLALDSAIRETAQADKQITHILSLLNQIAKVSIDYFAALLAEVDP